ncbi:MAG: hypothetical protein FJX59_07210 [Alphaproteobacteria bacterium]|nr:hypothetical protein [Alphaproteobacteria bacterium]
MNRLARRERGEALSFEAVRERIATYLRETVRRRALAQYVAVLAGDATIEGVDVRGAGGA